MEKLIRDNIIDIAWAKGERISYRLVSSIEDRIKLLCQKLEEECKEYRDAITVQERIEEAGDVLEVIDTLISIEPKQMFVLTRQYFTQQCVYDLLSLQEIYRGQKQKREEKGGFERGIVWIYE